MSAAAGWTVTFGDPCPFRELAQGLFLLDRGAQSVMLVKQWVTAGSPTVLDLRGYDWGPYSLRDSTVRPVFITYAGVAEPPALVTIGKPREPREPGESAPPELPGDDLFTALHRILGIDPTHPSMTHAAIRIDVTREGAAVAIITVPVGDVEVYEVTNLFAAAEWPWAGRTSRRLM